MKTNILFTLLLIRFYQVENIKSITYLTASRMSWVEWTYHYQIVKLSCLSRVAGCSFKGKSRFKSSKSSHRMSNANAKFQFLFWNTTGNFSFEAWQLILYFTIHTHVHVIQSSVNCKNMFFIITRHERGSWFSYVF